MKKIINLRLKLIKAIDQQIEKELSELNIPEHYLEKEKTILAGREKDFGIEANISANELPAFSNLWVNVAFRQREFDRAMGILLLYGNVGPVNFDGIISSDKSKANYSEHFWISYGDFVTKACSFLDSIGGFLAFVFFGIVNAPFYFHQVVDSLRSKYTYPSKLKYLDGEPFGLEGKESWGVLVDAQKRYNEVKSSRNEFIHAYSPLMYWLIDDEYMDEAKRQIVRKPTLDAGAVIDKCKEIYYLIKLVPIAADDISATFAGSGSYHRDFHHE